MRRSVLLAVWLGLVLSLLKGASAQNDPSPGTTQATTISGSTGASTQSETTSLPPQAPTTGSTETSPQSETTSLPTATTISGSTETSAVSESTSQPTETPTSRPPVDFCDGDPCGRNLAKCISLNSTHTCECEYGFYYSEKHCYRGKVFPASIAVNADYSESLKHVNSSEYEEVFENLNDFFEKAFKDLDGYEQTVIVEITRQTGNRNSGSVNVTVTNLFTENSVENETTVKSAAESATHLDQSYVSIYYEAQPCDVYQCDTNTTNCISERADEIPKCNCKPEFKRTEWDDRSCSVCSESCSAAAHKYCVQEEWGPKCKCMINFRSLESGSTCEACPLGYSGEECRDNTELILIIVGTVLGAAVLSLVIAVSIVSVRAKNKQNPEKRSLMKPGYSDINTSEDRPSMFPRVQTTSGHTNPGYQPNNPYEMRSTNRDRFPERDYDDLYEISREPRGFRTQSRY